MDKVTFADDRTDWMKKEDNFFLCFHRCVHFKECSSRHGIECNRFGGSEIPIMNRREGKKNGNRKGKNKNRR